jgi:hypothetical protein
VPLPDRAESPTLDVEAAGRPERVTLPDPREQPTMRVEDAGRVFFGLGRAKSYAEAARFERTGGAQGLPCIRFGRTLRAVTAACVRLVGLDDAPPPE